MPVSSGRKALETQTAFVGCLPAAGEGVNASLKISADSATAMRFGLALASRDPELVAGARQVGGKLVFPLASSLAMQ